jgi:hypothetical protein
MISLNFRFDDETREYMTKHLELANSFNPTNLEEDLLNYTTEFYKNQKLMLSCIENSIKFTKDIKKYDLGSNDNFFQIISLITPYSVVLGLVVIITIPVFSTYCIEDPKYIIPCTMYLRAI